MPIVAQDPVQTTVAAGGQTSFNFNFRCDDPATIQVYKNDVLQGGVTVTLNGDQVGAPGGHADLVAGALAGDVVEVERLTAKTQTLGLTAYLQFPAAVITAALDRIVEMIQEVSNKLDKRTVKVTRSNLLKMVDGNYLPLPSNGAFLGWRDDGTGHFALVNIDGVAEGEALVDSGDHIHFASLHPPIGNGRLYRNGQRIFAPDDYAVAGSTWTLVVAVNPLLNEKVNADYTYIA